MTPQESVIDYFTEAPLSEVCDTVNLAAVIIKTRQRYEPENAAPKRGRPPGIKNKAKTAEGSGA